MALSSDYNNDTKHAISAVTPIVNMAALCVEPSAGGFSFENCKRYAFVVNLWWHVLFLGMLESFLIASEEDVVFVVADPCLYFSES